MFAPGGFDQFVQRCQRLLEGLAQHAKEGDGIAQEAGQTGGLGLPADLHEPHAADVGGVTLDGVHQVAKCRVAPGTACLFDFFQELPSLALEFGHHLGQLDGVVVDAVELGEHADVEHFARDRHLGRRGRG